MPEVREPCQGESAAGPGGGGPGRARGRAEGQPNGRNGMAEPGRGNMWALYQAWREIPKAQETLRAGLIGSPETIRRRLREFEAAHVDQVILLNQTGRTLHEDICSSLDLFAREVAPKFHAREAEHQRWKSQLLEGRIALEQSDTSAHTVYAHQHEDIVRLTPEELKRKMAAKEAARAEGGLTSAPDRAP